MYRRPLIAALACSGVGLQHTRATGSPAYAVEIVDLPTGLAGGDRFDVTVRVTNTGDTAGTDRPVRLLVGGQLIAVDVARVSLAPDEATEVTLGYDTYPVQVDVEFPIRVESPTDAVERTIAVAGAERTADGEMSVTITDVDDEGVSGGETLRITVVFENTGETNINTVAQLVSVGKGAVVNELHLVLDPGESQTTIFTYETWPVQTDVTFEMAVCTPHTSDVATVSVAAQGSTPDAAGPYSVSVFDVNDPVTGGERLDVAASFANNGTERGTFTAELVVGGEVVDTVEIDMAGEATTIRTLGYDTYPVKVDVQFPVTVRTPDDSASAQVVVHGTETNGSGEARSSTGAESVDEGQGSSQAVEPPETDADDEAETDESEPTEDEESTEGEESEESTEDESDANESESDPAPESDESDAPAENETVDESEPPTSNETDEDAPSGDPESDATEDTPTEEKPESDDPADETDESGGDPADETTPAGNETAE